MVDIDERVVQMKFDSSDFESKTKSTFKILDQLNEKLSFKDAAGSDTFEQVADNVQKMADKAYTIVDRMIDKIKDDIANKLLSFIRENTVGQIASGWSKYADMTTAVATLKAQGYAMEEITDQLERLNYFTDETSYSFTNMVTEIGKFTASGKSLEESTLAMMGIANWAALSGKNANEASRAMYQLSQALGAGTMRMQDWKSIQNLNMDTIEFRKNAIEAAIELGTLRDNLNGTYTTLVGEKAGSLTFSLNEFADKLTKGAWFTSDVMMKVFGMYANAVDEIREIYEEGGVRIANGMEFEINTTADAIKYVKEKNKELTDKFKDTKLTSKEIDKTLSKWKKVEKVTDETVENYAEINKITKEQALNDMNKQWAEYLDEYNKIFSSSEESAEEALDNWKEYVSNFGIKAFRSAQEAKTFIEAIESAKDAASTVWTQMFQLIFGNYDEAKSLWTDLANGLYEVFVERLWSLKEIIQHWYDNEGRTIFFQGIYAYFSAIKDIIVNIREAWDNLFGGSEGAVERAGNNLLKFSEHFRISMFRFYMFMKNLSETDFYSNIAEAVHNVLEVLKTIKNIVGSVIKSFMPEGTSAITILVKITEVIKNLTAKLIPSQRAALNIARTLRGIVSVFRFIAKVITALAYVLFPIFDKIINFLKVLGSIILEFTGNLGDMIFYTEKNITCFQALEVVGRVLGDILEFVGTVIQKVLIRALKLLRPIIKSTVDLIKKLVNWIKELFKKSPGEAVNGFSEAIDNLLEKIKKAWTSTESLRSIFERFKGGTGLGNFFRMIGEMCTNVIKKIGNVILAVTGLEEVLSRTTLVKSVKNFRDLMVNIFMVIKWLFTNVILPVLGSVFEGIANLLDDTNDAVERGDLLTVLDNLKRIISVLNVMGIYKALKSINRLLGAGGILRIIRNVSKWIKGWTRYWNAQALNERATALQKLTVCIGILIGMLFLMAQIDDNTYLIMFDRLKLIAAAFGMLVGSLILLSVVVQWTRGGLLAFTFACLGLVLVLTVVWKAIKTVGEAIADMTTAETNSILAGAGTIALLVAGITVLFTLFGWIGSRAGAVLNTGMMLVGIGLALYGFAYALKETSELLMKYDYATLAQAFTIVAAGIVVLAFAMNMLNHTWESTSNLKSMFKSALGPALMSVIMIASMAFIMLPALESLAEHMDEFDRYLQGFLLFAGMMVTMAYAVDLIQRNAGILRSLAGMVFFQIFVHFVKSEITPLLQTLANPMYSSQEARSGAMNFAILILALAGAFDIICIGIQHLFEGIASLNWKSILSMIVGIAGIFAVISVFANGIRTGVVTLGTILAALGTLFATLAMLAIFVRIIAASMETAGEGNGQYVVQVVNSLFGMIAALGLIIVGGVTLCNALFGNEIGRMVGTFATLTISLMAVIITMSLAFGSLVNTIGEAVRDNDNAEYISETLSTILQIFITIAATFIISLGELIALQAMGVNIVGIIVFIGLLAAGISTVLGLMGSAFTKIFKSISKLFSDLKDGDGDRVISLLKTMFAIMIAIVTGFVAGIIAMGAAYSSGYEWQAGLNVALLGAAISVTLGMMAKSFGMMLEAINENKMTDKSKYKKAIAFIITFGLVTSAILVAIGGALALMMKYQDKIGAGRFIANAIVLIGSYALVVFVMTRSFNSIFNTLKGSKIDGKKLAVIESVLGAMLIMVIEMGWLLQQLSSADLADITGAMNVLISIVAIVGSITLSVIGLIKSMKGITISGQKIAVIAMTLGSILATIVLIGTVLLPSLENIKNIPSGTVFKALGSISLMIIVIGVITVALNKLLKSNMGNTIAGIVALMGSLFVMMGSINLFGEALVKFYVGFNNVEWDSVWRILANLIITLVALGGLGALIGVLIKGTKAMNIVGMLTILASILALGGILALFGEDIVKFFEGFNNIKEGSVGKALLAIVGILAIVTLIGTLVGVLTTSLRGVNILGMLIVAGTILGMAYILKLATPMFKEFFTMFENIDWDEIWKGLSVLALIGVGSAAIGGLMVAAAPGVILFIGVILALAGALYILAGAYNTFKGVSGDAGVEITDNSKEFAKVGKKEMDAYSDAQDEEYRKDKKIDSPSKIYKKYGKYIDQGLINGLKSNITGVKSASRTLAIATDETFCSELGIASPSKVFYENGRFVIRGLINGMDSESVALNNQGYDIGTNISDGIKDGMEDTDWEGIFGGGDFGEKIAAALDEGGIGLGDYMHQSIFGEDYEETDLSLLTEEERKAYDDAKNLLWQLQHQWAQNSDLVQFRYYGEQYRFLKSNEEDVERYNHQVSELEETIASLEKKATKKSNTGIGGTITSSIIGAFTSGDFKQAISNVGEAIGIDITGGISDFISDDGTVKDIGDVFSGVFDTLFGEGEDGEGKLTDRIEEVGKNIGDTIGTNVVGSFNIEGIFEKGVQLGKDFISGAVSGLGEQIAATPGIYWDALCILFGWDDDGIEINSQVIFDQYVDALKRQMTGYEYKGKALRPKTDEIEEAIKYSLWDLDVDFEDLMERSDFGSIMTNIYKAVVDDHNRDALAKALEDGVYGPFKDVLRKVLEEYEIKSPSRVFIWIGEMINKGFIEGIDENAKDVFKAMANLTEGVLDETDPLYDAINPRLTPVLDDSSIKNGIATANKSFNAMNPQVDATVSAYMKSMPNYSGDFESLENSIYNTNLLMGEILSMLESGDVTTVNVEVAPVPGNIYDTVINTNRERFRRTGINGFMI